MRFSLDRFNVRQDCGRFADAVACPDFRAPCYKGFREHLVFLTHFLRFFHWLVTSDDTLLRAFQNTWQYIGHIDSWTIQFLLHTDNLYSLYHRDSATHLGLFTRTFGLSLSNGQSYVSIFLILSSLLFVACTIGRSDVLFPLGCFLLTRTRTLHWHQHILYCRWLRFHGHCTFKGLAWTLLSCFY